MCSLVFYDWEFRCFVWATMGQLQISSLLVESQNYEFGQFCEVTNYEYIRYANIMVSENYEIMIKILQNQMKGLRLNDII